MTDRPGCLSAGACPRGRHYYVGRTEPGWTPTRCACGAQWPCPHGRHYVIDNPVEPWRPVCACGEPSWPCPHAVDPGAGYDTGAGACIAVHAEAKDIIQAALDILSGDSQEVRVLTKHGGGNALIWYGRLTGLGSMGFDATITISDVRSDANGPVIPGGPLLLEVDDVLEIKSI